MSYGNNIDVYLDSSSLVNTVYDLLNSKASPSVYFNLVKDNSTPLPDAVLCIGKSVFAFKEIYRFYSNRVKTIFLDLNLYPKNLPKINQDLPYFIICSNLKVKHEYLSIGMDPNRVFITGNPIIDRIKRINRLEKKGTIFFNFNYRFNKINQLKLIARLLYDTSLDYMIVNNFDKKILFTDKCIELKDWKIIKNALQYNRMQTITDKDSPFYYLINSDLCVSSEEDILIYSVLLSKPTVLLSDLDDKSKYGLVSYEDFDNLFKELDFTEDQINYYLSNFLPGVFDDKNSERVVFLLNQILQVEEESLKYSNTLMETFILKYPEFSDPLYFLKEEASSFLSGPNRVY